MKEKKASTLKTVVIAIFFVVIILVYFNSLSNDSSKKRTEKVKTELEQLSTYDMVNDYPKTARDVVKMHCRFFKMFYGETLTDDELYTMNQQIRYLYSEDLIDFNDETNNLTNLKKSIEKMKNEEYTYKSYVLPEASQIQYYTQNGVEMASMEVRVTVDMEDSIGYVYVQYVLVKENDQWKIQAWGESQMGQN